MMRLCWEGEKVSFFTAHPFESEIIHKKRCRNVLLLTTVLTTDLRKILNVIQKENAG